METPVTIKLQSTFNPNSGWNEQVPVVALSNGEVAICGFAPNAVYSLTDLRTILQAMEEASPEIAAQLIQQPGSSRRFAGAGQQLQQSSQQQRGGNLRDHLRQQQPQQGN